MSKINYKPILSSLIIFYFGHLVEYCLNVLLASNLSPELFSDFSLALKLLMLTSPLYILGIPHSIIKYIAKFNSSNDDKAMNQFFRWSLFKSLQMLLLFLVLFMVLFLLIFFINYFHRKMIISAHLFLYFQIFSPFVSGALFLSAFLLAYQKLISSILAQELVPFIFFITTFSFLFLGFYPKSIRNHSFRLQCKI